MSNDLIPPTPIVHVRDGMVYAGSREVAEFFGKQHRHVLDSIRELIEVQPDFSLPNFRQQYYVSGRNQKQPCFEMTRDGFTLLAMGFTGDKALQFKIKHIEAFNRMEATLKAPVAPELSAVGGVVKAIILKQVPALIEAAIIERIDAIVDAKLCRDPRLAAVSHVPALQVVENHKVPQKGRGGLVRRVSRRLERFCNSKGYPALSDVRGTNLFPAEAVSAWLTQEGRLLIQSCKDTLGGQQILPFKSRQS